MIVSELRAILDEYEDTTLVFVDGMGTFDPEPPSVKPMTDYATGEFLGICMSPVEG
jgi:hypothetical protein